MQIISSISLILQHFHVLHIFLRTSPDFCDFSKPLHHFLLKNEKKVDQFTVNVMVFMVVCFVRRHCRVTFSCVCVLLYTSRKHNTRIGQKRWSSVSCRCTHCVCQATRFAESEMFLHVVVSGIRPLLSRRSMH